MPSTIIFYMLYVQGGEAPKQSHLTYNEALAEAERLTRKTHKDVFILRAIQKIRLANPPIESIPLLQHAHEKKLEEQP